MVVNFIIHNSLLELLIFKYVKDIEHELMNDINDLKWKEN